MAKIPAGSVDFRRLSFEIDDAAEMLNVAFDRIQVYEAGERMPDHREGEKSRWRFAKRVNFSWETLDRINFSGLLVRSDGSACGPMPQLEILLREYRSGASNVSRIAESVSTASEDCTSG